MHLNLSMLCAAFGLLSGATGMSNMQPIAELLSHEGAQGVWQSDGYGIVVEVGGNGSEIRTFDRTDVACVETTGAETHFSFAGTGQISADGTKLTIRAREDVYDIRFNRLPEVPPACESSSSVDAKSSLQSFDAFVAYFSEHYAFFNVHNPEWLNQAAEFRKQLGENPGQGDIIQPMIALLSTLKDGHVSIRATVDGDEGEFIAYPGATLSSVQENYSGQGSPMAAFGNQFLRNDIEKNILGGNGQNTANERIKYGVTSDDIGYMAIMAMGSYLPDPDASEAEELEALNAALDEAFTAFDKAGVKALLIDLAVNRGGYDLLARAVARRFAQTRTLVTSKYAGDAHDKTPQPLFVEPVSRPGFSGPVYVLTSDVTASAAESLTLALRALPNVTHVGARTRGALSDVLEKKLPNEWVVTLSNEVYLDHEGNSWEGRGIPPEHEWAVFDPANPFSGHMPAVERTVALIDAQVR